MKKSALFPAIFFIFVLSSSCHYNPGPNPGTIIVVRPSAADTLIGGTHNYQVTWSGTDINSVKTFEYSLDSGITWMTIGTQVSDAYLYNWNVPDTASDYAFLRIIDKNGLTGKSGQFRIKPSRPPGPSKTIAAKSGSTYVYNNTPIDTSGHLMPDSSYLTVDSIAATGTTYKGKTNVTRITIRNLKTGLLTNNYLNYESNGDISEYVGGSILSFLGITYPDWVTYPMQTHVASSSKVADTTVNFPIGAGTNIPIRLIVLDSISYINTSTFSVNKISFGVFNLKHVTDYNGAITVIPGLPGIPFGTSALITISFAPSIGYYADRTRQPVKVPLGIFPSIKGSQMTLISFELK